MNMEELSTKLKGISNADLIEKIPLEIIRVMRGKELTFLQAEALLDYTKEVMKRYSML